MRGFKQSTYEIVGSFTSQTLIEYVPNGKRAGTKSAERYNVYAEAKTIEQALSLGSRVADLLNDFEKGLLRPVGRLREPGEGVSAEQFAALSQLDQTLYNFARRARGLKAMARAKGKAKGERAVNSEGKRHTRKETRERLPPPRAQRPLKCDGKMPLLSGETAQMQRGRLIADATAAQVLERAAIDGGRITDDDILRVFRQWRFKKNDARTNVLPEGKPWVFSDTLGLIRDRCGKYMLTGPSRYVEVCRVLNRWMKDNLSSAFCCTSISLNKGYAARLHRDSNNVGPSICRAIGNFKGGRLGYFRDDDSSHELEALQADHAQEAVYLDVKADFQLFDGLRGHFVEPFKGQRLSFVFFSVGKYWKTKPSMLAELRKRDFPLPSAEWMSHAESLLPQPRGYGSHRLPRMKSLVDMFKQTPPRVVVKRRAPIETAPNKKQPSVLASLLAANSHEDSYLCIYGSKGAVKLRGTSSGTCGTATRSCAGNF